MSVYYEEARRFGRLLLTSEQAVNLAEANAAFDKDEAAKAKMERYNAYQASIQEGLNHGAIQDAEKESAKKNLQTMLEDMKRDPIIGSLLKAEGEYNAFMNQVFGILRMTVGGDATGCGGCSGCK